MSSHKVEIKTEPSARPSALLPKISKIPSLFSPPSDNESKPEPPFLQTSTSSSFPFNDVHSNVVKQELVAHLNDVSSVQVGAPINIEPKLEEQNHHVISAHAEDIKKEKKHKEKKNKKEKHREKDREREEEKEKHDSSNGSKKHKHKHKEKSKHRDSDREKVHEEVVAAVPAIRLKIKTPLPPAPPTSVVPAPSSHQPPLVAPIKLKFNGDSDSSSRKRSREESDVTGIGPASKMSRVLGTSVESESKFLHVVGGSNSSHHLPPKSVKKVNKIFFYVYDF